MTGAAETVARVAQIQAMLAQQPVTLPAATAVKGQSFAAALQGAQQPTAAAGASGSAGGGATQYDALINDAATRNGVDPALLKALIRQESNFNPNARSGAGAVGLTQLMPSTAAGLGVGDPTDPAQAVEGGAKYLRQQLDRFGGDPAKALAAYNAGPGAVQRFGGVPPYAETQSYVQRVLGYAQEYGLGSSTTASPAPVQSMSPTLTNPITT
jgi:soluble lytic murein transglycosylase-like protein